MSVANRHSEQERHAALNGEGNQGFNVWNGVYRSFAEAPATGAGFAGDRWQQQSLDAAREGMRCLSEGRRLDRAISQRNALLPVLLATLLATSERVRVLDYGGGVGLGYLAVSEAISDLSRLDYHIVEVAQVCDVGRGLFGGGGPLFWERLPKGETFDIAYSASALQFVEDWHSAIAKLAESRPQFLLLSDVLSGNFETYATLQTYYESCIPCWFFNLAELVATVERQGYGLVLKTDCRAVILGREGPAPMDNFPRELRASNALHLLFGRRINSGQTAFQK